MCICAYAICNFVILSSNFYACLRGQHRRKYELACLPGGLRKASSYSLITQCISGLCLLAKHVTRQSVMRQIATDSVVLMKRLRVTFAVNPAVLCSSLNDFLSRSEISKKSSMIAYLNNCLCHRLDNRQLLGSKNRVTVWQKLLISTLVFHSFVQI